MRLMDQGLGSRASNDQGLNGIGILPHMNSGLSPLNLSPFFGGGGIPKNATIVTRKS